MSEATTLLNELADRLDQHFADTGREMVQLRADVDAATDSVRAAAKANLARHPGASPMYRGVLDSPEDSRQLGLAVLAFCLGQPGARTKIAGFAEFKAMAEGSDTSGGFLVGDAHHAQLIRLVEQFGVFRRNCFVVPMASDSDLWPKRTGGPTVYSPGEGAPITASDITVALIRLVAKKLCTLTVLSTELVEDSAIAVGELVALDIALAFAQTEDQCGFIGDGTSTYFGMTGVFEHADTQVQTCAATDTTFAKACKWKYLAAAVGLVPTWSLQFARWYFHRTVFWTHVVGQVDANDVPIVKFFASGMNEVAPLQLGAATPTLLGFPVELVDCLPTTSDDAVSTKVWAFGGLYSSWWMGQRAAIDIAVDRSVYFANDQVAIRGRERIDIEPADASGMVVTKTAAE